MPDEFHRALRIVRSRLAKHYVSSQASSGTINLEFREFGMHSTSFSAAELLAKLRNVRIMATDEQIYTALTGREACIVN